MFKLACTNLFFPKHLDSQKLSALNPAWKFNIPGEGRVVLTTYTGLSVPIKGESSQITPMLFHFLPADTDHVLGL